MTTAETISHPFAVFGPAPYHFVSLETTEDRELANSARRANGLSYTTNMCGGTCDLCGTSIWNVFTFEAANGERFRVGCDCADKAGEGHLAKAGRRHHNREIAERREHLKREERLAAEREYNLADPEIAEGLTNEEVSYWRRTLFELEEVLLRMSSRHFGTVGQRVKSIEVVYEGVFGFETMFGIKRIYRFRTRGGDALVWFTMGSLCGIRDVGDVITIAATVKKHGEYRDEQQTELTRVKFLSNGSAA